MTQSDKLLFIGLCPVCGEIPVVSFGPCARGLVVRCEACDLESPTFLFHKSEDGAETRAKAIEWWNMMVWTKAQAAHANAYLDSRLRES